MKSLFKLLVLALSVQVCSINALPLFDDGSGRLNWTGLKAQYNAATQLALNSSRNDLTAVKRLFNMILQSAEADLKNGIAQQFIKDNFDLQLIGEQLQGVKSAISVRADLEHNGEVCVTKQEREAIGYQMFVDSQQNQSGILNTSCSAPAQPNILSRNKGKIAAVTGVAASAAAAVKYVGGVSAVRGMASEVASKAKLMGQWYSAAAQYKFAELKDSKFVADNVARLQALPITKRHVGYAAAGVVTLVAAKKLYNYALGKVISSLTGLGSVSSVPAAAVAVPAQAAAPVATPAPEATIIEVSQEAPEFNYYD